MKQWTLVVKTSLFIFFCILLTACGSRLFINKPAENFQQLSCVIKTEICGVRYQNGGSIKYDVKELADLNYHVTGKVDIDWISTGKRKFAIFYVIFMDEDKVIHEERIRTYSNHASFDFEFETKTPVLTSTLAKIRWMVRT